jgi:signal transduction histidine kinase
MVQMDGISDLRDPEGLPQTRSEAQELSVLWGICHAFGSTAEVDNIVPATTRWVREALAYPDAGVRVSLNRGNRLEIAGSDGMDAISSAHSGAVAKLRRSVLTEKKASTIDLEDQAGASLAIFPLVSRGLAVGVVEIVAPTERLTGRWHTVEAVISQVAILIRNLGNQDRLKQAIKALEGSVDLVRDLLQAPTPEEAVRISVRLLHDQFDIPAAAWFYASTERSFELLATAGLDPEAVREFGRLERIPSIEDEMTDDQLNSLMQAFRSAAGNSTTETFVSDRVILLAGVEGEVQTTGLKAVTRLMFDALKNLSHVRLAESRNKTLDTAIGFAAHELKAPLTATKMLIDTLRHTQRIDQLMPALERSSAELSQMWTLVETLLDWSVGRPELDVAQLALAELIETTVNAVDEDGECRVDIQLDEGMKIAGDERQLGIAFGSLLRSALKHGSPHPVEVTVFAERDLIAIRVRDHGPPIQPGTEEALFDPFLKDRSFSTRASKGLGLFVARKIIEAHGGKIVFEPLPSGASLCVQLPVESGASL